MHKLKSVRKNLVLLAASGVLFLALACSGMSAAVFAAGDTDDEFTYSGPLDPDTNEPVREEQEADSGRVKLSETMYYDKNTRSFVYPINNGQSEVRSSAADGMVTSEPVTIYAASDTSIVVHQDGNQLSGKVQTLKNPGEYVISTQAGSDMTRLFSVTIVGKTTNGLQHFEVPEGFYMTGAELDGSGYYYTRFGTDLAAEGEYFLSYMCSASEKVYTLTVTIDRTPPELQFSGKIDEENQVRSALEFTGVEEGGSVVVTRDGAKVNARADSEGVYTLKDSGLYKIQDYDAAGNMTEYQYRIMMYFNVSSILFVLVAALLVIGIGIYVLIRRKSLKIG